MEWSNFKNMFHKTWHTSMKKWVESKDSAKVYAFLKNQRGKEIAPKSNLTFRTFEQPLNNVKVVVLLEEPYCDKYGDTHYADGIPLSCDFIDKKHTQLNEFYDALEREFYDLNLNTIKNNDLNFLTNQGVLFLSSSLTVEIGSPGKHKGLWTGLIGHLIKTVFCKRNIPIIFCGENLYQEYKFYVEPVFPYFVIKENIPKQIGVRWETEGKFLEFEEHLEAQLKDNVMWINQDVPY